MSPSDGGGIVGFANLPLPGESPALDDARPRLQTVATVDGFVHVGPSLAYLPMPPVKLTIRRPGASASIDLTREQVSQLIALLGDK